MSVLCTLRGHRAAPATIRNGGAHFSRCTRCAADLIETDGSWTAAPKGFRVVWKSAPEMAEAAPHDPAEKRAFGERRTAPRGALPAFLGGKERRRNRDRRRGFGRKRIA